MKKYFAVVLAVLLVFLTACGNMSSKKCGEDVVTFGEAETRDPLRICVDLGGDDMEFRYEAMREFERALKQTAGLTDFVIEYVPSPYLEGGRLPEDLSVRASAIDRLRVEILSGDGPDVFIMTYLLYVGKTGAEYDATDVLFKYPEKAMENGLFLPLDPYIENNTRFTEWDKLIQLVLEAGRNKEGQQIIPLTYTFPMLCYPKSEWEHIPDKKYTWNDMLTNPELLPYSLDLANCGYGVRMMGEDEDPFVWNTGYTHYILGKFADYENEQLSFTEEELLELVNTILSMERADKYYKTVEQAEEQYAGFVLRDQHFNKPMTFLPLYNVNGGITATVNYYAAVNRNTDRPEDAFTVIDLLLNKNIQQSAPIYTQIFYFGDDLPMHEDLFTKESPLAHTHMDYCMTDENFAAFCAVRDQITEVNFSGEGISMLSETITKCRQTEKFGMTVEEIVHETYEDLQRRVRE